MAQPQTLRLILGDQLNTEHSWFRQQEDHVCYLMAEIRQETDYVKHHIQKVTGFFAANLLAVKNFLAGTFRFGLNVRIPVVHIDVARCRLQCLQANM